MGRVLFIVSWVLVLAIAQTSRNQTVGLLAVVGCVFTIGPVLRRPNARAFAIGYMFRPACRTFDAVVWPPICLRRFLRRRTPADDIDIQVHLADRRRAGEIERCLRAALWRCAQTWAPQSLPLDRVSVQAGASATGQAQTYDHWLSDGTNTERSSVSLVVVSLGLYDSGGRPLNPDALAGVLASQVAGLVEDRYRREHASDASVAIQPASNATAAKDGGHPVLAETADRLTASDDGLSALMQRLRQQARPLEPETASAASTELTTK
jgi:hypothetical protein